MALKKFLKYFLLSALIMLTVLIAVVTYLFFPLSSPEIPNELLTDFDTKFENHMLKREGAHYYGDQSGEAFSDGEERFMQSIRNGVWGKTGIQINSKHLDGNYVRMQGGPMDIIEADTVEYVLYGKEVGQSYMPFRLAWNDVYEFSHSDYYLIRYDKLDHEGKIIREWLNQPNSYGHLTFDDNSKVMTVTICTIGYETLKVTDDLPTKDFGHSGLNLICSSENNLSVD